MTKPQVLRWSLPIATIAILMATASTALWMGLPGKARDGDTSPTVFAPDETGAIPSAPSDAPAPLITGEPSAPPLPPSEDTREPVAMELLWDADLPPLPVAQLEIDGLSGVFAGAHRGAMLVVGGSHYGKTPPWEGGTKTYLQRGWFLFPDLQGGFDWRPLPEPPLPQPLAHGASISTPWGLVVLGGNNQFECSAMARLLTWDGEAERLIIRELPPLPKPVTRAAGAMIGTTIHLVGGEHEAPAGEPATDFLSLDLGAWVRDPETAVWKELEPWDGPARSLAAVGVTFDGTEECLFVFGGRGLDEDGRTLALNDAHKFSPSSQSWTRVADIAPDGETVRGIMAAASAPGDAYELLVFGGDDNLMADVYHLLGQRVITSDDDAERWRALNRAIFENHPGYPREILRYNALEDKWTAVGHFPGKAPLANPVVDFAAGLVIPGGETSPGRRSHELLRVTWEDRVVIRRALPAEQPSAPEAAPAEEVEEKEPPSTPPLRPGDDPDVILEPLAPDQPAPLDLPIAESP